MENSIFIAKIISVIYLSFGIGLLFSRDYYKKIISKLLDDSSYLILGGFMAIIMGGIIIQYHNIWVKDWTVLVTIIGWIALVKGVVLLAFPKFFDFFKPLLQSKNLNKFMIPMVLGLGLIFAYFGFGG